MRYNGLCMVCCVSLAIIKLIKTSDGSIASDFPFGKSEAMNYTPYCV